MSSLDLYPCPVCEQKVLDEKPPGTFTICPVCNWEDDDLGFKYPDERVGGPNKLSLNEARADYKKEPQT